MFLVGSWAFGPKPTSTQDASSKDNEGPSAIGFEPTVQNRSATPGKAAQGMVWIAGGEFSMGCDDPTPGPCGGPDPMPDARPIHRVAVDGFWMDVTEVTNEQFQRFVD